jgi:ribosomal protein S18 acetylase RimI-like enzyme
MSRCTGQIRQMQSKDLGRVMDIWLQVSIQQYAFVSANVGQTPEAFWNSRLPHMIVDTLALDGYVFETNGQVLAFMTFDPAKGYIAELFVDLPFQDKGIGHALIDLAKSLRSLQPHLYAHVYEKKDDVAQFYERQGFRRSDDTHTEPGTGQTKLTMDWKGDSQQPAAEQ